MLRKPRFLINSLHILILFSLAVAQPIFDLLSGYPEFFVARGSDPLDLIFLALILCLGLPSLFIFLEGVARVVGPRLYKCAHAGLVAILTATIILQIVQRIAEMPGFALVTAAILLGIMGSVAYVRFEPVRTYLTFLSPAILLFPGLFLLNPGIYKIVFPEQIEVRLGNVEATAPVVMVVLDEFPLSSLMDEQRQIDPIRFPNLARFAKESHWFRNATTVSDSTLLSVPAILSGLSPQLQEPRIPTIADYPDTLFTLLGGSYRLHVFENGTQLSPTPSTEVGQTVSQRMSSLLSDLAIVYAHVLLPADLTSSLPPVDQSWNNFGSIIPEQREMEDDSNGVQTLEDFLYDTEDRAGRFREFVDSIQFEDRPALFFLHSMLPHPPWQYLPTGKQYSLRRSSIPGMTRADSGYGIFPAWGDDQLLVDQGYRRYLLQAAFVDLPVGDLIGKLEEVDLYDRSLVVITADHGASFRTNDFSRRASETNYADIMWIPLFVKTPYQEEGVVSDRNVETIDILPTVADALGIDVPWETDGRSALDQSSRERSDKTILAGRTEEFVVDPGLNSQDENLRRKLELFGSGSWDSLFAHGAYADLLGKQVHEIGVGESGFGVELEGERFFENVNFDSPFLLTNITGHISAGRNTYPSRHLAVAVNDRIQSVTEISPQFDSAREFSALVAETAFLPGKNDVEVFFVIEVDGRPRLEHLSKESRSSYSLISSTEEQTETLQTSDGGSVPIVPGDAFGYVRAAMNEESETVSISGWAVDVTQSEGATVLVFHNQELVHSGTPHTERPDVAEAYEEWASLTPGFRFELPLAKFDDLDHTEVRVFALSQGGTASELNYIREGWVFAFSSPTTN